MLAAPPEAAVDVRSSGWLSVNRNYLDISRFTPLPVAAAICSVARPNFWWGRVCVRLDLLQTYWYSSKIAVLLYDLT